MKQNKKGIIYSTIALLMFLTAYILIFTLDIFDEVLYTLLDFENSDFWIGYVIIGLVIGGLILSTKISEKYKDCKYSKIVFYICISIFLMTIIVIILFLIDIFINIIHFLFTWGT